MRFMFQNATSAVIRDIKYRNISTSLQQCIAKLDELDTDCPNFNMQFVEIVDSTFDNCWTIAYVSVVR